MNTEEAGCTGAWSGNEAWWIGNYLATAASAPGRSNRDGPGSRAAGRNPTIRQSMDGMGCIALRRWGFGDFPELPTSFLGGVAHPTRALARALARAPGAHPLGPWWTPGQTSP